MSFPNSHKTVFLLDRSSAFHESSKQPVDFDMFMKAKAPGLIPLAPISKSLWTCNVEAVLEYVRIVYDVFPFSKLIQLIVSEGDAVSLNSWNQQEQNLQHLTGMLARLRPPNNDHLVSNDCTIFNGINLAVEKLCEPSIIQHKVRTSLTESASSCENRGRIICLSSFDSDEFIRKVESYVLNMLNQHNKLAMSTDVLMPVDHCELVLVDLVPLGKQSICSNQPKKQLSPYLTSEVHSSQSGRFIAIKLVELVMSHFNLSSTTVTGIPMKEEQNAMSSANYDVELLHSSDAHVDLIRSGHREGLVAPSKEGLYTDTVTLKWCTPKTTAVELQQCNGAFRITPVDVNSRPSSCLTNFLLSGRSVMLEQPRKTGNKIISHMLSSHGGEIYIHVLSTWRSMLEDPPSISEGAGGRLTDYRINDFGELMKENLLGPVTDASDLSMLPIKRAQAQLERMTRYWPLVIGETIIFNMTSIIDPLPSLLMKETLSEAEVVECKKVIYHVVGMETRNDPLPNPASGARGKSSKREEQYRQMWNELERFVRAYSNTSASHGKVLECVMECKRKNNDDSPTGQLAKVKEEKVFASDTSVDRSSKPSTEKDRQDMRKSDAKKEPESPCAKRFKIGFGHNRSAASQSLLSMWTNRIKLEHKATCPEFAGRQDSPGTKAELYKHLKDTSNGEGGHGINEKTGGGRGGSHKSNISLA